MPCVLCWHYRSCPGTLLGGWGKNWGSLIVQGGLDEADAPWSASAGLKYPCGGMSGGKKGGTTTLEMPPVGTLPPSIDPATATSFPTINQGPFGKWGASGHPSQAVIVRGNAA